MRSLEDLFDGVDKPSPALLRVLAPDAYRHKDKPACPPVLFGRISPLFALKSMQIGHEHDPTPLKQKLKRGFEAALLRKIPFEVVMDFNAFVDLRWMVPGKGRLASTPHIDGLGIIEKGEFTATASLFPTTTYPGVTLNTHLAHVTDARDRGLETYEDLTGEYAPHAQEGPPGRMMLWNQDALVHRGFVNTLTMDEWRERLKPYRYGERLLREDGAVWSVAVISTMRLNMGWLNEVHAHSKALGYVPG